MFIKIKLIIFFLFKTYLVEKNNIKYYQQRIKM